MNPIVPFGGFLACQTFNSEQSVLLESLKSDPLAHSVQFSEAGIVMAAWPQFPGQGLWSQDGCAVAYDLDLTNTSELCRLVDIDNQSLDYGALLWNLYQKYGCKFIDHLRGAFAFALWDGDKHELFVVTDCYGIRPVVHTQQQGLFAAASRIKQLELVGISKEIDPEAIYHYLFFQAICSPVSIYKSVRKLEPGKNLLVSGEGVQEQTWYDLNYRPVTGKSEADWCRSVSAEVEKAVGNFVPQINKEKTGCFLSGGTDSSSVVGYYTKQTESAVKTFSIGFDDPKYNELDFARIAVDRFGSDQHEYLVTPDDVLNLIEFLPQAYDEPMGNASVVAAYYCAKLAREHGVETMLGGDGGDEIFGGNERYVTNLIFKRYADLPVFLRKGLFEPLLKLLPDSGLFYKAKRYVRRANMPNPRRFYSYNLLAEMDNAEIFQPDFLAQVDTDWFFQRAQQVYDQAAPADETDRLLYLDMKYTITDNDLRKVTQMVEAAGIQVGYPLLDKDLVDFTCTIPPNLKVKPGKNRYIFKEAMRGFLPDEIISKSKHGMGLPIAKWLRDDKALNALLEENLFSETTQLTKYVRPEYLRELRDKLYTEETSFYGDNLWVFLVLEMWLREHI